MRKKAPGKGYRKGITLKKIMQMFPNDVTAEAWFIEQRWPTGIACPRCGSLNVQVGCKHPTMPFRCREKVCGRKMFSVKTGTVMEGSKIGYQDWIIATFEIMTSLKSVASMKLHRDLGITQKSAWFLSQRLRYALSQDGNMDALFSGPVEVDETYIGGKRGNMSNSKRKELANTGRGSVGKTAIVGVKDRATRQVAAKVVHSTNAENLARLRQGSRSVRGNRLYGRCDGIRLFAVQSCCHQALTLRIRQGRRSHERHRVALVDDQASAQGDLPQAVTQAP